MSEVTPITIDEDGTESHPSFGLISASRVQASPAQNLFDSEIKHRQFVTLRIEAATRKRDIGQDWIHGDRRSYIEVAMSEAQWASFVSSLNTSPVPCTIETLAGKQVPDAPYEPRLRLSTEYATSAAERMFEQAQKALEAVKEKPSKANLRALELALDNSRPNVEYAAKTLTEHAENVVVKARADIEAMVARHAARLGIDSADAPILLGEGDPE